jgi:hypothetical protein
MSLIQHSVEFKFNKDCASAELIQKYAGTSHGLTLTVLSIIDIVNKGLNVDMLCVNEKQMFNYLAQVRNVLQNSKVVNVFFRSLRVNGVFQDKYEDMNLEHDNSCPVDHNKLKTQTQCICDIQVIGDVQTWSFWRRAENIPRVLKFSFKK